MVVHMKEKFCKGSIFILPFLTGPDMRYERGHCGILPKNCRVAPSPLRHVASLIPPGRKFSLIPPGYLTFGILLRRHFHPGISHPEFFSADISTRVSHIWNSVRPTFHLLRISHIRNSVQPTFHFLRISHIRNSVRSTFHLFRIFHIRHLTSDGRGRRFNFPGQTCPDPLIALTRKASAANNSDSLDSLARQIFAIRRIHFHPQ